MSLILLLTKFSTKRKTIKKTTNKYTQKTNRTTQIFLVIHPAINAVGTDRSIAVTNATFFGDRLLNLSIDKFQYLFRGLDNFHNFKDLAISQLNNCLSVKQKFIPHTFDGSDTIYIKFLPDFSDMNIYRPVADYNIISPNSVQNFVS